MTRDPPDIEPDRMFGTRTPPNDPVRIGRIAAFTVLAIIGSTLAVTITCVWLAKG